MEKLTSELISIHLPNKLIVLNKVGAEMELLGIKGDKAILKGRWMNATVPIDTITPLVRPLAQLTEEIEHNGIRCTPYNILKLYNADGYHFNIDERQLKTIIKEGRLDFGKMPYWMVIQCAMWHFDIHGLLKRKLAKPIYNSLSR